MKTGKNLNHFRQRAHTASFFAGFTLIEVLIAVVIFALMAAMAYRGLGAILDSKRHVDAENDKWRKVAVLFTRLERDLAVATPLPIRNAKGSYSDALNGEATIIGDDGAQLAFTRMGSTDDTSALAAPQRVGYRLRDGNVELLLWPVLDQAPQTKPEVSVLIEDIAELTFRYFDENEQALPRWPRVNVDKGSPKLPNSVEAKITLKSGEVLTRRFDLPAIG